MSLVLPACSPAGETEGPPCQEASGSIGVRNAHVMAYDEARSRVVLFGGANSARVCADTWELDASGWQRASGEGPPARTFAGMAYDAGRGRSLLFGGNRVLFGRRGLFGGGPQESDFLADLWEWDGDRWSELARSEPWPPARAEAAVAFDDRRDRLVLFGGYARTAKGMERFGDTWEWDGEAWRLASSAGPRPQNGAAMTYDGARGRTVLFGGGDDDSVGETWEWDGVAWERVESADSPRRYNSAMAFDRDRAKVVRFGGWTGDDRSAETWQYDGASWTPLAVSGPEARNHSALVFDRTSGGLVLFGGHDGDHVFGDAWVLDREGWRSLFHVPPERRLDNGH